MGYIIIGLIFVAGAFFIFNNLFSDIKKNKNIKNMFKELNVKVTSDFSFLKEKILHINLLDSAQNKVGSIQFIGYKEIEKGDKIALIQFKYVDKNGEEFLALDDDLKNKAQPLPNGDSIVYDINYNNNELSVSIIGFEIFSKNIGNVFYYEVLNADSKRIKIQ